MKDFVFEDERDFSDGDIVQWLNEKNHELGFEVLLSLLRNTLEGIKSSAGVGGSGDTYTWRFSYILEVAMTRERERENKVWSPSKLNALEKRIEQLELMVLKGND